MINIAIDGPSGAGKSTVAKAVAKELGILHLDTGAMYRATAYAALQNGIDVKDESAVSAMLNLFDMDIKYANGVQQIFVNGFNATPFLREHNMSKAASDISAHGSVRKKMVELQRELASHCDMVLDGRDICTCVLPNANCKFYITASAEERAKRRVGELEGNGQTADYDTILQDINERDYNDTHRAISPLKRDEGAEFIDSTSMTISEVVKHVIKVVNDKTRK